MKLEMKVTCPNCHRKFTQRVEEMRPGRSGKCPGCGMTFKFKGDDGAKTQRSLDDFGRSMKRLSGKLKFRA